MTDPHHVLLDDRALVEVLGRVVGGGADQLDAALVGMTVGLGAGERRQERVMDVDHRTAHPREEVGGEDLHVAREHEQLGVAGELVERALLGLRLCLSA